jgi:hypothetical protein
MKSLTKILFALIMLSICMVPIKGGTLLQVENGKIIENQGSDIVPIDYDKLLQGFGYLTDTTEQIIEACKDRNNDVVRFIALELLVTRSKEKAIPTLKVALEDKEFTVRYRAAHWLGTLGDKSGLERMRQDFKEFASNNGASFSPDPNIKNPEDIKEQEGKLNYNLYNAILAAKVLAEINDHSGYALAAKMCLENKWKMQRYDAMLTLIEIAKTDQATLRAENLNPVFVLSSMANSTTDDNVILVVLTNQVSKQLNADTAIQIIEEVINSPRASENSKKFAQMMIQDIEKKKKASQTK